MALQELNAQATAFEISEALLRDGGVVVHPDLDLTLIDRIHQELAQPFVEQGAAFKNDFNGYHTLRITPGRRPLSNPDSGGRISNIGHVGAG
jgi:hypothetical protein